MAKLSLKYRLLKRLIKLLGVKKVFQIDERIMREHAWQLMKRTEVPAFSHPELNYEIKTFKGSKVIYMTHKTPTEEACLFLVGGGMLRHPYKRAVKEAMEIAVESGRDLILPYYPLCIDHSIDEVYDWLYALYKSLLERYEPQNVLFSGSSSGATLSLALVSHMNALGDTESIPRRIYASSACQCFNHPELFERGYELSKKDILIDMPYLEYADHLMTHGKDLPDYMIYLDKGDYHGLEEVYLCYGSDEIPYAVCDIVSKRLRECGVHVITEIGPNLYHCYPFLPIVKEAKPGWRRMLAYHSKYRH